MRFLFDLTHAALEGTHKSLLPRYRFLSRLKFHVERFLSNVLRSREVFSFDLSLPVFGVEFRRHLPIFCSNIVKAPHGTSSKRCSSRLRNCFAKRIVGAR